MERCSGRGGGGLKRPAERDVRAVVRKGGEEQSNRSPPLKKPFSKTSLTSSMPSTISTRASKTSLTSGMPSTISTRASKGPTTSHNRHDTGSMTDLSVEEVVEGDTEEEVASEIDSQGGSDVEGAELIIEGAVMV